MNREEDDHDDDSCDSAQYNRKVHSRASIENGTSSSVTFDSQPRSSDHIRPGQEFEIEYVGKGQAKFRPRGNNGPFGGIDRDLSEETVQIGSTVRPMLRGEWNVVENGGNIWHIVELVLEDGKTGTGLTL